MESLLLAFGATEITLVSVFGAIFLILLIYYCIVPLKSWFTALFAGCYIPSFRLISLKSRKFNVKDIVSAYIMAKKANKNISLNEIETLVTSGGNIVNVIKAMNMAEEASIKLGFSLACAIELASGDVFNIVHDAIVSKVVEVKDIKGFTQDNIEIIANAKFSVKVNINKYLSSLGLEDLKNNVSAWIMENISKTKDHKTLLAEPNQNLLSNMDLRVITQKSMYEMYDINISSIEMGRDLNMESEMRQAEKDKIYASIEAERMKNKEEIKEIQMRAKTEEMKSTVLQAEAEVPQAISQAIKEGRFSVMDYYKLMNLQADTALRRAIISDNNKKQDADDGDLY